MSTSTPTTTATAEKERRVHFVVPIEEIYWFDGVTEEERDDCWWRRGDYVDFIENELRRRELLHEIETQNKVASAAAAAAAAAAETTSEETNNDNTTTTTTTTAKTPPNLQQAKQATTEPGLNHRFTRKMVSRTFSAGPHVRRRRLPRRESKNELDDSNHESQFALRAARASITATKQQQQQQQQPQQQALTA